MVLLEVPLRPLILNVDDFEPQRYARSSILRSAGFDVIEAVTAAGGRTPGQKSKVP